jgi:predicted porin
MNRMLTILVVLSFCLAGLAMAGDGSPLIYGQVHLSYAMQDNGTDSSMHLTSNTSRIGVKGSNDIDTFMPLNAFWQVESDINWGGGTTSWAGRNSFFGLKTEDYGSLLVGHRDTPFKDVGKAFDLFRYRLGESRNATAPFGNLGWDMRPYNVLMYSSPMVSGAHAKIMVSEDPTNLMSLCVGYHKDDVGGGNVMAAAAMEMHNSDISGGPETETGIRVGGSYSQDLFKVNVLFQTISNSGGVKDMKAMTYGGGASYNVNDETTVKGQVFMLDPNTDMDKDGAMIMTFGVDYMLDQATTVYGVFTMTSNQDASMWGNGMGGYDNRGANGFSPLAAGDSVMGVGAGMTMNF